MGNLLEQGTLARRLQLNQHAFDTQIETQRILPFAESGVAN
jgi:hypothetical protein